MQGNAFRNIVHILLSGSGLTGRSARKTSLVYFCGRARFQGVFTL